MDYANWPERYQGKPLLRLLECWVLAVIGELDPAYDAPLAELAPHLARTYGGEGSWQEIIARQLGFTTATEEGIRQLWREARERHPDLEPQAFAEMTIDASFDI